MNFIDAFNQGQEGKNKGLPTGLAPLDRAIDGVQRKSMYGVAAGPKVGKSTLTDFSFVINPILYAIENNVDLKIPYFSYEIDRVKKEFDFASHFFLRDYELSTFTYQDKEYPISSRYLQGRLRGEDNEPILLQENHAELLMEIYQNRIIKFFGEYDSDGNKLSEGYIDFFDVRDNPTGMRKTVKALAEKWGKFVYKEFKTDNGKFKMPIAYIPHNPDKYVIIVTDHIRKLKRERGYSLKQNMDKWIEYSVEFRNLCYFSFVHIVHLNRAISNIERLKYNGEFVYPTGDDVKDSGNLSEECDYLLTLMNPTDEKYGLKKHFGIDLTKVENYRSIHLVESRDTECPMHLKTQMHGAQKYFTTL